MFPNPFFHIFDVKLHFLGFLIDKLDLTDQLTLNLLESFLGFLNLLFMSPNGA